MVVPWLRWYVSYSSFVLLFEIIFRSSVVGVRVDRNFVVSERSTGPCSFESCFPLKTFV